MKSRQQNWRDEILLPPTKGSGFSLVITLVLSIEYGPEISGGVGTQVRELTTALSELGETVIVVAFTLGPGSIRGFHHCQTHLLALPEYLARAGELGISENILKANNLLYEYSRSLIEKGLAPDIIQCENWLTFDAAYKLRDDYSIPVISTIHYLSEPVERWWGQIPDPLVVEQEGRTIREADHLVAVSESLRSLIASEYHVSPRKCTVVHNALLLEDFVPRDLSVEQRIRLIRSLKAEERQIVLYSGRIHPQKGVLALFEALEELMITRDDFIFVIAGSPDSRSYARKVSEAFDARPLLKERSRQLGKLTRRQLAVLYQVSNLAVVPSVYEPFGYSALEAMASGIPTIASDVGGLREIIQHNVSGILVPVRCLASGTREIDKSRLSSECERLLANPDAARILGAMARRVVSDRFQALDMARSTLSVYVRVVEQFRASGGLHMHDASQERQTN
jgi:Glycosyltransferase